MTGCDCHDVCVDDQELRRLGLLVAVERQRAGLSKEAAARKAKISSITWKRVEDGLRVQDAKLRAILDAVGLATEAIGVSSVDDTIRAQLIGGVDRDEDEIASMFGVETKRATKIVFIDADGNPVSDEDDVNFRRAFRSWVLRDPMRFADLLREAADAIEEDADPDTDRVHVSTDLDMVDTRFRSVRGGRPQQAEETALAADHDETSIEDEQGHDEHP